MYRFIIVSFLFLGGAFWALSGGSSFEPPAPKKAGERVLVTYTAQTAKDMRTSGIIAPTALVVEPTSVAYDTPAPTAVATNDTTQETYQPQVTTSDVRQVSATRVNMRAGPSTEFGVLDRLAQGDRVRVVDNNDAGWVQLRVEKTGEIGWMAERLLTPVAN